MKSVAKFLPVLFVSFAFSACVNDADFALVEKTAQFIQQIQISKDLFENQVEQSILIVVDDSGSMEDLIPQLKTPFLNMVEALSQTVNLKIYAVKMSDVDPNELAQNRVKIKAGAMVEIDPRANPNYDALRAFFENVTDSQSTTREPGLGIAAEWLKSIHESDEYTLNNIVFVTNEDNDGDVRIEDAGFSYLVRRARQPSQSFHSPTMCVAPEGSYAGVPDLPETPVLDLSNKFHRYYCEEINPPVGALEDTTGFRHFAHTDNGKMCDNYEKIICKTEGDTPGELVDVETDEYNFQIYDVETCRPAPGSKQRRTHRPNRYIEDPLVSQAMGFSHCAAYTCRENFRPYYGKGVDGDGFYPVKDWDGPEECPVGVNYPGEVFEKKTIAYDPDKIHEQLTPIFYVNLWLNFYDADKFSGNDVFAAKAYASKGDKDWVTEAYRFDDYKTEMQLRRILTVRNNADGEYIDYLNNPQLVEMISLPATTSEREEPTFARPEAFRRWASRQFPYMDLFAHTVAARSTARCEDASISGSINGEQYFRLSEQTGGLDQDICVNRDFTDILEKLETRVEEGAQPTFHLNATVKDPSRIEVSNLRTGVILVAGVDFELIQLPGQTLLRLRDIAFEAKKVKLGDLLNIDAVSYNRE